MNKLVGSLALIFVLNGCSSIQPIYPNAETVNLPDLTAKDMTIVENGKKRHKTRIELLTTESSAAKAEIKSAKVNPLPPVEKRIPTPTIPITKESSQFTVDYSKKLYNFWMKYYLKRDRKRFQRHMDRGHKVEEIVKATMRKHNLPEELFYVGLIESGYSERIRSHADAVGPWQFIKGTATRYGLRVDRYVDERYNIIKASEASAGYFKDLYNIFGSWELALAAYNAGEYRIINAIRRGNTRNFSELVAKKLLPKETIYYVPKVMAAKDIYESRKTFGFVVPNKRVNPFIGTSKTKFTSSFSLNKMAKKLGVSYSKLKKMNPDVKTGWIHINRGRSYQLIVPDTKVAKAGAVAKVYKEKRQAPKKKRLAKLNKKIAAFKAAYRVQRGDNLSRIARMFNTRISKIKKVNRMRSTRVYVGQKIQIPGLKATTYTVKRGDNLGRIARRFRTSIASIKGLNGLKNSRIYPKQKIQVPVKS